MLKIVSVVDKVGTAIDRLAQQLVPYMDNMNYVVCDVHPKRPDDTQMAKFIREVWDADIVHFEYFRTAQMLLKLMPELKEKKLILSHYNPYSIKESEWDDFDIVTADNKSIYKDLKTIVKNPDKRLKLIPLASDPYFWKFNFDFVPGKRVIMVANRIESKKGILEVAIACGELELTFVLVGAISDREYFYSILQTGNVEFHERISDEELRDLYHSSTIHVCNSVDNFESGTMPILEAMQCGVPVLTRNVGHVPDLKNEDNLVILEGQPNDVQGIKDALENMLADTKQLEKQRQSAWNTAKNFNPVRRAYTYQRLYRSLQEGEPVSVIVPVYDKPETIRACLNAIAMQDYPNIELIVCDDQPQAVINRSLVEEFSTTVSFPVRYINTAKPSQHRGVSDDYGLARARNMGIIEATGDILVFCDQRQIMAVNAVSEFVKNLVPKSWLFGDKGGNKTTFVENFSCVSRSDLIEAGMFNERITAYGGMSQEIRARTRAQGFTHRYVESAKATPMGKSSNRNRKKEDIIAMKDILWKVGL